MKMMDQRVVVVLAPLLLAACQTVPQAGLVYSSAVNFGVGLKVSGAEATSPVDISIGFKTADVAYVPVAVVEERSKNREGIEKIWGSHGQSTGQSPECLAAKQEKANETAKGANANVEAIRAKSAKVESLCDFKRDALSVYGQFDGIASASGGDKAVGLGVGRVFATGVAAQNVSLSARIKATSACVEAISKAFSGDAAKLAAALEKYCAQSDGN